MKKVTLRAYAQMNKLSYFQVMKMVRTQEIKSISVLENDKEVEYILLEEEGNKALVNKIDTPSPKISVEEENELLKQEIVALKKALEKCNKRTILA